ncbi:MAG: hypothetical protein R6U11_06765 [Bacteroidales bacterium]
MQQSNKTFVQLNKRFFWDVDYQNLDINKNKELIIERILTLGDISDFVNLISIYGKKEIINTAVNTAYLDKKTLNWLSIITGIPKTQFKCYSKIQSKHVHWSF